jgi:hypothetical protein
MDILSIFGVVIMYKIINETTVLKVANSAAIPYDPANTDYQQFKKDVLAGETLERPDGTPMTEADAYIATLP